MYSSQANSIMRKRHATITLMALMCLCTTAQADSQSPFCFLPPDPAEAWLPVTPSPQEAGVPAPRPASDCQFYRPAWQRFLVATQPTGSSPAFLNYPPFDQIFAADHTISSQSNTSGQSFKLKLLQRNIQLPNDPTGVQQKLVDDNQAGIGGGPGGNLIDQHGHFVYYAIHVNPAFLKFLHNENLTTVPGIKKIDPNLTFLGSDLDIATGANTNVMELKSAWMIVDGKNPPPTYFVVPAEIPHYVVNGDKLGPELINLAAAARQS
jgi:hypothetical protein